MRFPVRALAAVIAIFALLFALALPANADLFCALPDAALLPPHLETSGRESCVAVVRPQPVTLRSVQSPRASPLG
jgi:hypothetical protein